jgi:predicted Fe-S protein YdhL (DUF1289 family)
MVCCGGSVKGYGYVTDRIGADIDKDEFCGCLRSYKERVASGVEDGQKSVLMSWQFATKAERNAAS